MLRNLHGLATQGYAFGTRLRRSSLKTVRRTVSLTLRPSQCPSPFLIIKNTHNTRMGIMCVWYAGRDSVLLRNPHSLSTQAFGFGTRLRRSSLKTSHCDVFLTLRPSQCPSPFLIIKNTHNTQIGIMCVWYAGRDSVLLRNPHSLSTQAFGFGTRLRRSSLKTSHCDVFLTLRPSQCPSPFLIIKNTHNTQIGIMCVWYAGRDSNPRPTGS